MNDKDDNSDSLTKLDVIQAFREYRTAVKIITAIHSDLMYTSLTTDNSDEVNIPKERLEDYKRAREHLERSITLNPFFPDAYLFLANSYWEIEDDLHKTVDYYNKAIEIDPDYDDVISARGQVFIALKQIEEAERDLLLLEALDSEFAEALRYQIAELKYKRTKT